MGGVASSGGTWGGGCMAGAPSGWHERGQLEREGRGKKKREGGAQGVRVLSTVETFSNANSHTVSRRMSVTWCFSGTRLRDGKAHP